MIIFESKQILVCILSDENLRLDGKHLLFEGSLIELFIFAMRNLLEYYYEFFFKAFMFIGRFLFV